MRWFVLFLLLVLGVPSLAVTPYEVIGWTKEGVPEAVIVERIRKSPSVTSLTAHEALELKAAGVSDLVLRALIEVGSKSPGKPAPVVEPTPVETSKSPTALVVKSVDDIIEAHRAGTPSRELAARARGLTLKLTRADRERLQAAGVDDEVIAAAASRPVSGATRRTFGDDPSGFGSSGTILLEFAGGFQSFSAGDTTVSAVHLAPSLHVWLGLFTLGLDTAFTSGAAGQTSVFAVIGPAIGFGGSGDKTGLFRLGVRLGYGAPESGDGAVAYGFGASVMSRAGRLLVGAGLTGTWLGDPVVSVFGAELRIGTWF